MKRSTVWVALVSAVLILVIVLVSSTVLSRAEHDRDAAERKAAASLAQAQAAQARIDELQFQLVLLAGDAKTNAFGILLLQAQLEKLGVAPVVHRTVVAVPVPVKPGKGPKH